MQHRLTVILFFPIQTVQVQQIKFQLQQLPLAELQQ